MLALKEIWKRELVTPVPRISGRGPLYVDLTDVIKRALRAARATRPRLLMVTKSDCRIDTHIAPMTLPDDLTIFRALLPLLQEIHT